MKEKGRTIFLIIFGSLILTLAFEIFFIPAQIAPGGLTGLATLFHYLLGWPVGTVALILNFPLFIVAFKSLGKNFIWRSAFATFVLSVLLDILNLSPLTGDKILNAVFGGFLMGVGSGLILYCDATTGGTDMLAKVLHKRYPYFAIHWVLFSLDAIVVLLSVALISAESGLYALLALVIGAKVMEVLVGNQRAKSVTIISDKSHELEITLKKEAGKNMSLWQEQFIINGKEQKVIRCLAYRQDIHRIKTIVKTYDEKAFVMILDTRETIGEEFLPS